MSWQSIIKNRRGFGSSPFDFADRYDEKRDEDKMFIFTRSDRDQLNSKLEDVVKLAYKISKKRGFVRHDHVQELEKRISKLKSFIGGGLK
jgi:uncharacterized coiled-coil DUF342 family protein